MTRPGFPLPANGIKGLTYAGNLSPTETWQHLADNPRAIIIDVRTPEEWAYVGHVDVDRLFLIGNVNCGLLDTGTEAECVESAHYALEHGMPGGRYIFSTSNCVYTGMDLRRYELMLDIWRSEGNYAK